MHDIAGWVAAICTMIAAMMTAANLGARVTGWGFVLFLVGAIAWVIVALGNGQHDLLWSNAFLGVVDIVGIWRWLGQRAKVDDGADEASRRTAGTKTPLLSVAIFDGAALGDDQGETIGHTLGAMVDTTDGAISYVVAKESEPVGNDHRYVALPWHWLSLRDDRLCLVAGRSLRQLPAIDPTAWPIAPI